MENMDFLPPTAPSLDFARETDMPYTINALRFAAQWYFYMILLHLPGMRRNPDSL